MAKAFGRANETRSTRTALTDKQAAVVEALCTAAEKGIELNRQTLGELAGYGKGETARVGAQRALGHPLVREAIMERLKAMALMDAPAALATLRQVRATGTTSNRLTAAVESLRIAGLGGEQAANVAPVSLHFHLSAHTLDSVPSHQPQVIDVQGESVSDIPLAKGTRRVTRSKALTATPPPPPERARARPKGRGQKRA
jgi:hypothetical protein